MSRVNLTKYHISSDPYPAGFFWNSCHVYNLAPKSGPSESRSPLQVDRGSKETNLILANPTAPMTLLELLSNLQNQNRITENQLKLKQNQHTINGNA